MADFRAHQQPYGSSTNKHVDIDVYNYIAGFDEYAGCLGIQALEDLDVTVPDVDTATAELQLYASNHQTTTPIIYPWMKRRRRPDGISQCYVT